MKQENSSLAQTALKPKRKSWETAKEKRKRKEAKNYLNTHCMQGTLLGSYLILFISIQVGTFCFTTDRKDPQRIIVLPKVTRQKILEPKFKLGSGNNV